MLLGMIDGPVKRKQVFSFFILLFDNQYNFFNSFCQKIMNCNGNTLIV